jgi:hypothetical protein
MDFEFPESMNVLTRKIKGPLYYFPDSAAASQCCGLNTENTSPGLGCGRVTVSEIVAGGLTVPDAAGFRIGIHKTAAG